MRRELMIDHLKEIFGDTGEKIRVFFAPGRVNFFGGHDDSNGMPALGCALPLGTMAAARLRSDRMIRVCRLNNKEGIREFSLDDDLENGKQDNWFDFFKSIFWIFLQRGCELPCGLDVVMEGDIPPRAGLALSGSLEILTAWILNEMYELDGINARQLAVLAHRAETEYVGMSCSIIDQFVPAMSKAGNAMFLSTTRLSAEHIPMHLQDLELIVTDSRIRHRRDEAENFVRRKECEKALNKLKVVANIHRICDLDTDRFESMKDVIMNDTYTRRAYFLVYEKARTIRAVSALRVNNMKRFGELMSISHASLRDDYEISCHEIDYLVDQAQNMEGVLGSRMTGGGFGGSTISLVRKDAAEAFRETISRNYRERFGLEAEFYTVTPDDGARELL
ncbi:MAG: galactokinase [Lachnospiraceae bacterium]|nr:galactokinase [Lachnospiraceae bacterium]